MLATIAFAVKILFTILCVVVLSLGNSSIITRDKVGLFALIAIISTSQGVMTDAKARQLKIGGEILCYIW